MPITNSKLLILVFCSSLVGCLNSEEKKTSSSETASDLPTVMMSSVSSDTKCNASRQGSIVYDQVQRQFFFCSDNQWTSVDLKGPKGDTGDKGVDGSVGAAGSSGAPGISGSNGRDGMDGSGIRLALKDGNQVKGILVQYEMEGNSQKALMMLPTGDLIYIDVNTGIFGGKAMYVYFSEPGCTGVAYAGRTDFLGPHTVGRIYVGSTNAGSPIVFYRAEEWVNDANIIQFKSYRDYGTLGQMHQCKESVGGMSGLYMRVVEIPAVPSLSYLAPIRFTP